MTGIGKIESYATGKFIRRQNDDIISDYSLMVEALFRAGRISESNYRSGCAFVQSLSSRINDWYDIRADDESTSRTPEPAGIISLEDTRVSHVLATRDFDYIFNNDASHYSELVVDAVDDESAYQSDLILKRYMLSSLITDFNLVKDGHVNDVNLQALTSNELYSIAALVYYVLQDDDHLIDLEVADISDMPYRGIYTLAHDAIHDFVTH